MTDITITDIDKNEIEIDISIDDDINWVDYVNGMEDLFLLEQLSIKELIQKLYDSVFITIYQAWDEIFKIGVFCSFNDVEKTVEVILNVDFYELWWPKLFDNLVNAMKCDKWDILEDISNGRTIDFKGFKYPVGRLAEYIKLYD